MGTGTCVKIAHWGKFVDKLLVLIFGKEILRSVALSPLCLSFGWP